MWPWEHVAVGYVLFSLGLRLSGRAGPADVEAICLLGATLFPDVIDKTLSWGFGVFPTGYAVGHSVFVALPVGLLVLGRGIPRLPRRASVAVVVGYWSHLLGDVLDPLRYNDGLIVDRVLWPVATELPYETEYGLRRGLVYLEAFLAELASMDASTVFLLYLLLPIGTVLLWLFDSAPGAAPVIRVLARLRNAARWGR